MTFPRYLPAASRPAVFGQVALILAGFALASPVGAQEATDWGARAEQVEIIRDEYGVPHIYAPSDALAVLGAAWAQAEDNWPQVEDNFLRALGRGSQVHGESALVDDYLVRAMRIPELARREYAAASSQMKAMYDAYAAGFNLFLDRHPEQNAGLFEFIEPWYTLALIRFKYHHNEYLGYAGLDRADVRRLMERDGYLDSSTSQVSLAFQRERSPNGERALGSNEAALAGRHTSTGAPLLLINPHVAFFGLSQYWEVHLESEEGLRFSGQGRYGFMLPYMGHSDFLGWAYTDNYADIGDLYLESVDDPEHPARYRFGTGWRPVEEWSEDIVVRVPEQGVETRRMVFRRTHHGPIVGLHEDETEALRPIAARIAKLEEGGWFAQWYGQMKARSLSEWRTAASALSVAYQNTMYADRDGNIYYVYNSAVPRRDESIDWSRFVDGSDPATEWRGYHSFDELPQVLNPASGWLQNTNSDPLEATEGLSWARSDFPGYMIGRETQNARAVSATRILAGLAREGEVSLNRFAEAVLDTRFSAADSLIPVLLQAGADQVGADSDIGAALELLKAWDRTAATGSVETTLFVRWASELQRRDRQRRGQEGPQATSNAVPALERVLQRLEEEWGTWRVAWGDVNRLQRPDAAGVAPFSDALPSLAVPAAPGWLGSFFTFHTRTSPGGVVGYGIHGNSFVKVISFGEEIEARSILTFGSSGHRESPHWFDQAPLYADKRFKPAWFSRSAVEAHAERRYAPGSP